MSEPTGDDAPKSESGTAARPIPKCPICGKPREVAYRPFCSKRCADVDLGRWLNERYVVPGSADSDEDGDDASGAAQQRKDEGDGF